MNELSIEEKAKVYDEAIEKAKEYFNSPRTCFDIEQLCNVFPELKESEDEKIREALIDGFKIYDDGSSFNGCLVREILAWLEKQGEKGAKGNDREIPNTAWSEEDKTNIQRALFYVNFYQTHEADTKESGECFDWLKSLKERVQPKQEWSEEDKRIIDNLVSQLGNLYARKLIKEETKDKYVNWLKSLRPQNTWKPSDEQIKILNTCLVTGIVLEEDDVKVLRTLLEQLKAL